MVGCYSQTFGHSCKCQILGSMVPTVKSWAVDNVKPVLFSDESTFTMWRSTKEAHHPDCCVPKHGGGSVMGTQSLGSNIMAFSTVLYVFITAKDYRTILENHVHLMLQTLYPERGAMYQHDNAPIHTARFVTECFDEYEIQVKHLAWPAQ